MCSLTSGFHWVPARADNVAAAACPAWPARTWPKRRCAAGQQLFDFHPADSSSSNCNKRWWHHTALSRQEFARVLDGRTLRIIGDSVSLAHYRYLTGCVLNCSNPTQPITSRMQRQWSHELAKTGHDAHAIEWATKLLKVAAAKDGHASGCAVGRGRVDFRRVDVLPGTERWHKHNTTHAAVVAAFMEVLISLPADRALSRRDIVLINFGLHLSHKLRGMVLGMLKWWQSFQSAPRLLWRENSPQHWPLAPNGKYRAHADVRATASAPCKAVPESLGSSQAAADTLAYYDQNVSSTVRQLALAMRSATRASRSDTTLNHAPRFSVLPVFAASWERHEDHPPLHDGALSLSVKQMAELRGPNGTHLEDCTHQCVPGSTLRFWTQTLLAWLSGQALE